MLTIGEREGVSLHSGSVHPRASLGGFSATSPHPNPYAGPDTGNGHRFPAVHSGAVLTQLHKCCPLGWKPLAKSGQLVCRAGMDHVVPTNVGSREQWGTSASDSRTPVSFQDLAGLLISPWLVSSSLLICSFPHSWLGPEHRWTHRANGASLEKGRTEQAGEGARQFGGTSLSCKGP